MVTSVIEASRDRDCITMTEEIGQATMALRDFLRRKVYTASLAKADEEKAIDLLVSLYQYFCDNPEKMPSLYFNNIPTDGLERCVCDYISGMTDRYAINMYEDIFIPKVWKG